MYTRNRMKDSGKAIMKKRSRREDNLTKRELDKEGYVLIEGETKKKRAIDLQGNLLGEERKRGRKW